jgi:hypothetical protein
MVLNLSFCYGLQAAQAHGAPRTFFTQQLRTMPSPGFAPKCTPFCHQQCCKALTDQSASIGRADLAASMFRTCSELANVVSDGRSPQKQH